MASNSISLRIEFDNSIDLESNCIELVEIHCVPTFMRIRDDVDEL